MKQTEFIDLLRYYLLNFPETVVREITNYYQDLFARNITQGMSEEEIAKALGSPKEVANEYLKGDFASLVTPTRGFRHWVLLIILVIASPFIALLTLIGVAIIFCFIFCVLVVLVYYTVGLPLSIPRPDWFNGAIIRLYFFQSAPPLVKLIAGCLTAFALLIFLKYTGHFFDYLMQRLRRCWLTLKWKYARGF